MIATRVAFVAVVCGVVGLAQQAKAEGLVITSVATSSGGAIGQFTAAPAAASVGGGSTTFTYTIALEAYSSLYMPPGGVSTPGFVEIFDFAGLQGGFQFTPDAASGLSASDLFLSTPFSTPSPLPSLNAASAQDNANIMNLKADFHRATPFVNNTAHTIVLGTLSAISQYSQTTTGRYISANTDGAGITAGDLGLISVPDAGVPSDPIGLSAPLPNSAWAGLGLLGLVGVARLRRAHA